MDVRERNKTTKQGKRKKKKVKLCQMVDQVGWLVIIIAGIGVGSDPSDNFLGGPFPHTTFTTQTPIYPAALL